MAGKSIKKNIVWQVWIEITNMLLPLVTSPILARRLGAESLGKYTYVYTITYYFVQFALLGMFQYGTREIAVSRNDQDQLNTRFTELVCFQLLHGGLIVVFFLIYSLCISDYSNLMLIELLYLFGASVLLVNYLFAGLEEFRIIALKTMFIRITGVVLIVMLVKTPEDLPVYTLIMAAEPLAGAAVYIFLARNRVKLVRVKLKNVFRHTKGLYLLFIPIMASFLYVTMDKVMLGRMSTMTQLGLYGNAEKALIAKNLAVAFSVVLVPRMANLIGESKREEFQTLLEKSMNIVLLLTIAFGFGTAAISSVFSIVFWGTDFAPCSELIQVMSFTLPIYGLTYVINNQYLIPIRKEKVFIWATLIGVLVNLVLNLYLIPKYNAFGAAIATFFTQLFVLIYECISIRKEVKVLKTLPKSVPYIIIGVVMMVVVSRLDSTISYSVFTLILEIIVGSSIYSVLCFLYWKVTGNEMYLELLRSFLKRVPRK